MTRKELIDFFNSRGLTADQFWIGAEHPALENFALDLLKDRDSKLVLEIGYQAGGFAVPVICHLHGDTAFRYTGVDNLSYGNSVNGEIIRDYLRLQGISEERFHFAVGDASAFLLGCADQGLAFDLILVDHMKPLYVRDLTLILTANLLADEGVVLLHDVLTRAAVPWKRCALICDLLGYSWEIREEIPEGVAVVRNCELSTTRRLLKRALGVAARLLARWA